MNAYLDNELKYHICIRSPSKLGIRLRILKTPFLCFTETRPSAGYCELAAATNVARSRGRFIVD